MLSGAIRLVVKSRRRLVRDAICAYLSGRPEFAVVGHTGAIDALAELCVLSRPDAVLVDSVEFTTQKVESLRRMRAAAPQAEVVVTYGALSPRALEAATRAGITALVPCSRGLDAVLRLVRERARTDRRRQPDGMALTDYDLRIVSLMSAGHSVPEMAQLLQISPNTVENHKRRLYVKLGVGSSGQAMSRATAYGLLDPIPPGRRTRVEEPGHVPLVVAHGAPGSTLDRVQLALLAGGMPVVRGIASGREHWAGWQRGLILAVLVDPAHDDWLVPAALGARTVAVLSEEPDFPTLVDMLLRGAYALVRGDAVATDLTAVLATVVRGYLSLDAARVAELSEWMAARLAGPLAVAPALTRRESEVLGALAGGHSIRQTAGLLGITGKTVEGAQARLYRKLGARNRAEALANAHRLGLLDAAGGDPTDVLGTP